MKQLPKMENPACSHLHPLQYCMITSGEKHYLRFLCADLVRNENPEAEVFIFFLFNIQVLYKWMGGKDKICKHLIVISP